MNFYYDNFYLEINKIRHNENINSAMLNYVENYILFSYRNNNAMRLTSTDKKLLIALKAAELCTDTTTGLQVTKAKIQAFARNNRIATPNTVSALIELAIRSNYLTIGKASRDRREVPLLPTEHFQKCITSFAALHLSPLSILFGEAYSGLNCNLSDASRYASEIYLRSFIYHNPNASARLFSQRDAGYVILMKIFKLSGALIGKPNNVVTLPFSRLSRTLGVSRAHVQKVLQMAERAELVSILTAGGKEIEIRPRLIAVSRNMIIAALANAKVAMDSSPARSDVVHAKRHFNETLPAFIG